MLHLQTLFRRLQVRGNSMGLQRPAKPCLIDEGIWHAFSLWYRRVAETRRYYRIVMGIALFWAAILVLIMLFYKR